MGTMGREGHEDCTVKLRSACLLDREGAEEGGLLVKNCKLRLQLFFVDLLRFGKLGVASDLRDVRTEVYYDA